MGRTEFRIVIFGNLSLEQKFYLIRKILKRSDLECIIVSTSNARPLGQILSSYKQQIKSVDVVRKK